MDSLLTPTVDHNASLLSSFDQLLSNSTLDHIKFDRELKANHRESAFYKPSPGSPRPGSPDILAEASAVLLLTPMPSSAPSENTATCNLSTIASGCTNNITSTGGAVSIGASALSQD